MYGTYVPHHVGYYYYQINGRIEVGDASCITVHAPAHSSFIWISAEALPTNPRYARPVSLISFSALNRNARDLLSSSAILPKRIF